MHALMIAPQPFFQLRGTPFSIRERLRALTQLGHTVDLVSYHVGESVPLAGVRLHRSFPLPIRRVPVGPSWVKFPLDLALAVRVAALIPRMRHVDWVHSHEEGALVGCVVARILKVPHVYDMHSSLPQQLVNYRFTNPRLLVSMARRAERWIIRHSDAVIVVCPWLEGVVRGVDREKPVFLIENPPICAPPSPDSAREAEALRMELGLDRRPVVLYTGTFEVNQGVDLLVESAALVAARVPSVAFVLVGGTPRQAEAMRELIHAKGLAGHFVLTGQRSFSQMPAFMEMAHVLVSPRLVGENTPLKIYSYLQAGKPIVATNLLTHTQVLDDRTALLVAPTAQSLAEGIVRCLVDPTLARSLGQAARDLAAQRYSWPRFLEATERLCGFLADLRNARQ